MTIKKKNTTHFGYRDVLADEKASLVSGVFDSVASKYDLMNDLMSMGLHRYWKQYLIQKANIRPEYFILDVASGTGDLAYQLAKKLKHSSQMIMSDINHTMLKQGRDRLINKGLISIPCIEADAESLPFKNNTFDRITIAFGLRNVTNQIDAIHAMYQALKPGGMILILEFSHPNHPFLNQIYDFYSFHFIPKLGEWVTQDRNSYQYLVESIRKHPNQETLKSMMLEAEFEDVTYDNLSGGIVALHTGYKY